MSNQRKLKMNGPSPRGTPPPSTAELIDAILNGVPEGRVRPEIAENLRWHLAQNPGDPDKALMNHFKDNAPGLENAILKRDQEN